MAFEHAFARLRLKTPSICRQCRRSMASSTQPPNGQTATAAFTELLQASRAENLAERSSVPHPPRRANAPPSPSPGAPGPNGPSPYSIGMDLIRNRSNASQKRASEQEAAVERGWNRRDIEQQIPRRFKPGDVYAPHDLSGVEMSKWKKLRRKPRVGSHGTDVLDSLGVDPRQHYKNFSMMAEYVSEMGRIKHRTETGLRPVNQRRMAKAIRRAIGTGMMPSVYRHPELLREELRVRARSHKY